MSWTLEHIPLEMADVVAMTLIRSGDLLGAVAIWTSQNEMLTRQAAIILDSSSDQESTTVEIVNVLRNLSVSHNKIGDVLVSKGELDGALEAYQASLAIRERLAAADPANTQWQRDLIVSHVKLSASGGDAKIHLAAALEIAERLMAEGKLAPADHWMVDELEQRLAQTVSADR